MKPFNKKTSAVLGAAVAATLSAGIASAVWTSPTGDGNSSATGYTAVKADVTASTGNANSSDATSLFPGSTVTNTVTVSNPNPYPIKVTAITNGAGNAAGGAANACAAGTVNVTSQSVAAGIAQNDAGSTVAIPAHGTGTYNVAVTMASTANNACQGLSFTLPVTISSQSSGF